MFCGATPPASALEVGEGRMGLQDWGCAQVLRRHFTGVWQGTRVSSSSSPGLCTAE